MIKINELDSILAREVEPMKVDNISFDIQKLEELFKTRFSESFENLKSATQNSENGKLLYRGDRKLNKEVAILTPGKRASQNTSNYYTVLMSHLLPTWKDFPKRDSSFICSTLRGRAFSYAQSNENLYHVFPENGANIGICSEGDFWESCDYQLSFYCHNSHALPDFNEAIGELYLRMHRFLNIEIEDDENILQTPEDFIKFEKIYVQILDRLVDLYDRSDELNKEEKGEFEKIKNIFSASIITDRMASEYIDDCIPLLKKLDQDLLNAKVNKNKTCHIKDMPNVEKREVWTDATCLFISADTMNKLIYQDILDKWFEGR